MNKHENPIYNTCINVIPNVFHRKDSLYVYLHIKVNKLSIGLNFVT